ncbi:glycosyltransferase [Clostridiaceae bacterium]|jgi:glycosyltransferase involved in cell wall biosynthesis|nr:glycosyltransferase [Clostridiaceae bacterium]
MKKILWIAQVVTYDGVAHAGGQNFNYYLKRLNENPAISIQVAGFAQKNELSKLTYDKYHIENRVFCEESEIRKFAGKCDSFISKLLIFSRYAGIVKGYKVKKIKSYLRELRKMGYVPDCVILHWTQILLMEYYIKKVFPACKVVAIEEDVTFLGLRRRAGREKNILKKIYFYLGYFCLKYREISSINHIDCVFTTNEKDLELLRKQGIRTSAYALTPFFHNMIDLRRNEKIDNFNIIYFGAMSREQNYLSAIWFIENVIPFLDKKYHFFVIGNNPVPLLKSYESEQIHIVGYVDDIRPYFKESFCFVAPIVLGAGIKIKVVEALSAGIPVLTNEIGIEGINAKAGKDYFYCSEAKDYIETIEKLENNPQLFSMLSTNAKYFVEKNLDYEKSFKWFEKYILL